mmetsp:Transcript_174421/g.559129  ORF Transcript_174421/g.559129 Transcript_174421/m.559129 type:complete len:282 (+) Transcript_174421:470-1315(+)
MEPGRVGVPQLVTLVQVDAVRPAVGIAARGRLHLPTGAPLSLPQVPRELQRRRLAVARGLETLDGPRMCPVLLVDPTPLLLAIVRQERSLPSSVEERQATLQLPDLDDDSAGVGLRRAQAHRGDRPRRQQRGQRLPRGRGGRRGVVAEAGRPRRPAACATALQELDERLRVLLLRRQGGGLDDGLHEGALREDKAEALGHSSAFWRYQDGHLLAHVKRIAIGSVEQHPIRLDNQLVNLSILLFCRDVLRDRGHGRLGRHRCGGHEKPGRDLPLGSALTPCR